MQTYIVMDLEWNQSAVGKSGSIPGFPFEIIEIGAVKLDAALKRIDEFSRLVRPAVYPRLHFRVSEVVGIDMDELRENGSCFKEVCTDFLNWCFKDGENPIFCTWGEMDIFQLENNMHYHHMPSRFKFPLLYYDIQKLYALASTGAHKIADPLDHAVDELHIDSDENFHRALADAEYTAKVMQEMNFSQYKNYLSIDYYALPQNETEQIYLGLPGYDKFVSMEFPSKEDCLSAKPVAEMICPICHKIIKRQVKWFTTNQRQYHCIAVCPEHGYVKGKLRIKHTPGEKIFAVKTIKLVNAEKAAAVADRLEEFKKLRAEKKKKH